MPVIVEHTVGKAFKHVGRTTDGGAFVGVVVGRLVTVEGVAPGQRAAAVKHLTTADPLVSTAIAAEFRHVVTPESVFSATRGVISDRQETNGSVRAKPFRPPSALQEVGSCVKQLGAGLGVDVAVVAVTVA